MKFSKCFYPVAELNLYLTKRWNSFTNTLPCRSHLYSNIICFYFTSVDVQV